MILVVDFGGQTAHLITRRLKQLGVPTMFLPPEEVLLNTIPAGTEGIIFSGGPMSVYEKNAPTIDRKIFTLSIPQLDICYGLQLRAHLLGGKVEAGRKEYGPVTINIQYPISNIKYPILKGVPQEATVWMSHGDSVLSMPKNFTILGSSAHVPYAFVADEKNKHYGVQFHPEIEHTEIGMQVLKNFVEICRPMSSRTTGERSPKKRDFSPSAGSGVEMTTEEMIEHIRKTVGSNIVIGAVSGGVDSTVAGALVAKAVGKQFIPLFVNNGLMREDAALTVTKAFTSFGVEPRIIDVQKEMLAKLKGITDSEEKRKIIGNFYIEVFEREMQKITEKSVILIRQLAEKNLPRKEDPSARPQDDKSIFLLQGTIYSDVIESQGSKHAAKIKSHHNVGGLPKDMQFTLLEPLRNLYKDEVRALGKAIGLPDAYIQKQPFPGPGYAVRIRGEVTPKRLAQEKQADKIVLEELQDAGLLAKVFISFPVMTDSYSTAVKGDGRFFGEVVALRVIESKDIMSSVWARLPYDVLQKISSRIVNEVPDISRVVYDISTKPPATMEWE